MRAIKIDVVKKDVYEVDVNNSLEAIYQQLECDCFTTVAINFRNSDSLLVDDEGLLHEPLGAFIIGTYPQPLSGHGLIQGVGEEGETIPAKSKLDYIKSIVVFVDPSKLPEPKIEFYPL